MRNYPKMNIIRTEQIWIKEDKNISGLCHLSKNLYNEANYIVRQEFSKTGRWIRNYDLDHLLHQSDNYKSLPSQTSQQILKLVDESWKSFFNTMKEYKKHPEKFRGRPKIPRYKKKNGEYILVFTSWRKGIEKGWLILPKKVGLKIRTRIKEGLRQVRIIPKGVGYVVEIIYEKMLNVVEKDKERIAGIDFGSVNIITMVNNIGEKPIVVKDDGCGIKSINQFYNKRKSELQSIYDLQNIKDGDKLKRLRVKCEKKAKDYIHKLTRFIVNWCTRYNIGLIIFGYNKNWKQNVKIGKRNNQMFTQIPFADIIERTQYKAEEIGIEVKVQEESYTSKCSFLDNESVEQHEKYLGRRKTRSLFRSGDGTIIHADVNAGYNIIRKAIPKAFISGRIGGCGLHPVQYRIDSNSQRGLD